MAGLLFLLLLLSSPSLFAAGAAAEYEAHSCNGTTGNFTAGSAFATNLDRLISSLPGAAASSPSLFASSPDAAAYGLALCRGDVTDATACSSCLAGAFARLRRLCGGARDATLYADLCTARYSGADFLARADGGDNAPVINGMSDTNATTYAGWDARNATSRSFFLSLVGTLFGEMAMYGAYNSSRRLASAVMFINAGLPTVYGLAQCTPDLAPAQCWHCFQGIADLNTGADPWVSTIVDRDLFYYKLVHSNDFPLSLKNLSGSADPDPDNNTWIRPCLNRQWYHGREGGRISGVRCSFRYEGYQFYQGTPNVRIGLEHAGGSAPNNGGTDVGSSHKKVLIIALVVSITVVCGLLLAGLLIIRTQRKRAGKMRRRPMQPHSRNSSKTEEALKLWRIEESTSEFTLYDFAELAAATGDFSDENRLGKGGFGPVYKGKLADGAEIAVKRLAAHSGQGLEEFKNEIQLIAKLQHTNLVRLVGCCVQDEEKMLVYEYMPNRSLDCFIFDQQHGTLLDWEKRRRIIEGIAQGLLYLHKQHSRVRIIHRDLKASNILLDKELNPKISDFGIARIFGSNMTEANTNRVVGTYGYMSPEYASEGIFSIKSDVYSFGVLLLEIVSGKRNSGHHQYGDFINLLGYAWQRWREGRAFELIDPTLGERGDAAAIVRCVKVALLCVQDSAADRPTMADVTAMLAAATSDGGGASTSLPDPRRPPHFSLRVSTSEEDRGSSEARTRSSSSSHATTSCSTNELTVTTIQEGR